MTQQEETTLSAPYWSPYIAGAAIGLTLVLTYYVMGHGVGASGAYTQFAARLLRMIDAERAAGNAYFAPYLQSGSFWQSWIVVELAAVFIGGFFGALTARRLRFAVERGPRVSRGGRLALALVGGGLVGFGSRLAQGCTSGQALSGGAVLAVGSWLFTLMFFLGGYLFARIFRREWQ